MLIFFYLSNLLLPKLQLTLLPNGDVVESSDFQWVDFQTSLDYFIGITKVCCWCLALYHLIYVEVCLEWRSDRHRYWRSPWNLLDVGTYLLVVSTIPFEVLQGFDAARECLLSVLSILLCVNLMQTLLVSSFFSVLIFTFARMCRVVAQFLFHYLLLLLGFSGAFHLLFHGLGPHTDFLSSMRIVFLATFGELNYSKNFHFEHILNARNVVGFVLLVFYVVVVTIVALNLMTALMTSEYENVRSQAEERALLELAGALHRYEKWLGRHVVKQLYESPRGVKLLQTCVRRIPGATAMESRSSSNSRELLGSGQVQPRSMGCRSTKGRRFFNRSPSFQSSGSVKTSSSTARMDSSTNTTTLGEVSTGELMKRMADEIANVRTEMTAQMDELKSLLQLQHTAGKGSGAIHTSGPHSGN